MTVAQKQTSQDRGLSTSFLQILFHERDMKKLQTAIMPRSCQYDLHINCFINTPESSLLDQRLTVCLTILNLRSESRSGPPLDHRETLTFEPAVVVTRAVLRDNVSLLANVGEGRVGGLTASFCKESFDSWAC